MTKEELKQFLPHREPMLLVDETNIDENKVAHSKYTIRQDEYFLKGHFPGAPVVPGVILCEIMAQSCALLMKDDLPGHLTFYTGINNVRFKSSVYPGDTVEVEAILSSKRLNLYFCEAKLSVNGNLCVSGSLSFALIKDNREVSETASDAQKPTITSIEQPTISQKLAVADIVVAGGYGMKSKENFALLHQLATLLGGEVGATRAATDAGFEDSERMIGQTGVKVSPKLYIACGLSGVIQHRSGISPSATIISINSDPNAPINSIADYVIIGDAMEIVPKMIATIKNILPNIKREGVINQTDKLFKSSHYNNNNYFTDNESLSFHLSHPTTSKIIRLKERALKEEDARFAYVTALKQIGKIAAETIETNAQKVDEEGAKLIDNRIVYASGTQLNHETIKAAGLYGISLPRKYNGLNFPYFSYVMTAEIVARADAGFANIWGLQDCAETIAEYGSEELKQKYLPLISEGYTCSMDLTEPDAGSDLQSAKLRASYDEESKCWKLNGVKRFITNGDSDIHLVLARSEEGSVDGRGLSLFLVDNCQKKSIIIRRIENKLGIKGSPTAEIVFNDTPAHLIGERRLGLIKYVISLMNGARLGVGAQSVGLCEATYREAIKYANEREQFSKAIINFPQVKEILDRMRAKTDAVRTLLYETARYVDLSKIYESISKERTLTAEERKEFKNSQRNSDMLTPILKLFASEFANQNGYDCIQVHGGSGYIKEYKCERLYRDARVLSLYEGTSQLQVVAALRFINNGSAIKLIEEYEAVDTPAQFDPLKILLHKMKEDFATMLNYELAERMKVEAAGYIIMGHLLLQDTTRSIMSHSAELHNRLATSCRDFILLGKSEIAKSLDFICTKTSLSIS